MAVVEFGTNLRYEQENSLDRASHIQFVSFFIRSENGVAAAVAMTSQEGINFITNHNGMEQGFYVVWINYYLR